jgi:hypothetical protein
VCALGTFLSWSWLVICFMVLVVMGIRHPPVLDPAPPLDPRRRRLALAAAGMLALSFTPIPLEMLPLEPTPGVLVERGSEIEHEGHRSVVHQRDLHPRPEPPGRDL